jgi:hypothetical protein
MAFIKMVAAPEVLEKGPEVSGRMVFIGSEQWA